MYIENNQIKKYVSFWLVSLFWLMAIMIIIGGLTRLTDSGLSITQWQLFSGFLPPLNNTDWDKYFHLYKEIPEFKIQNFEMTLNEFKIIFWWEWVHRFLGRLIGICVVFSNEGKLRKLYRKYNISEKNSGNDIGSMAELIRRRFSIDKQKEIPSLVIIDGGKTHLRSAVKEFRKLGINKVNVISISKGVRRKALFDSIHLSNGETISMIEGSTFNHFIQEIRDETHRYAITSLKKRRSKASVGSFIDGLSGVGQTRKKLLLRYFGSLEQIKRASVDDLCEVSTIGKNTAQLIFNQIHI